VGRFSLLASATLIAAAAGAAAAEIAQPPGETRRSRPAEATVDVAGLPRGFSVALVSALSGQDFYVTGRDAASTRGILAYTSDGGHHFTARTMPPEPAPGMDSDDMLVQLGFATPLIGYAAENFFGGPTPNFVVFATRDGGRSWTSTSIWGESLSLEASDGRVQALAGSCLERCSSWRLVTRSATGVSSIHPVPPAGGATLAMTTAGGTTWLYTNNTSDVEASTITGTGAQSAWFWPSGLDGSCQLAAASPTVVWATCASSSGEGRQRLLRSVDAGAHFADLGSLPGQGQLLALSPQRALLTANDHSEVVLVVVREHRASFEPALGTDRFGFVSPLASAPPLGFPSGEVRAATVSRRDADRARRTVLLYRTTNLGARWLAYELQEP
jgi:hypothetical protein